MTDIISFEERSQRLRSLVHGAPVLHDSGLVSLLTITPETRARVVTALNIYLWSCLSAAYPDKTFAITDDMLRDYTQDVAKLPNVTPNGLVLPKRENQLAFNLLQKETIAAFAALGFGDRVARVQYPVNVRLQNGAPDDKIDSRPRASVKPHSDIWAGDPASGILVFLSALGKAEYCGIDFLEPAAFPRSFVRPLEDYLEGAPLMEGAKVISRFDERGWYLADPYLIHRTTKSGAGYRISLDFRFIPLQRVSSDIDEDKTREPWFISFNDWKEIGSTRMLVTEEGIREFNPSTRKDAYTVGYPVNLKTVDLKAFYDASDLKKAG